MPLTLKARGIIDRENKNKMEKTIEFVVKEHNKITIKRFKINKVTGQVIGLNSSYFLTPAEIVQDLIDNRLSESYVTVLRNLGVEDCILEHHGLGRNIRNHYGLWIPNNPYTNIKSSNDPAFPDQVSQNIIIELINYFQSKAFDVAGGVCK